MEFKSNDMKNKFCVLTAAHNLIQIYTRRDEKFDKKVKAV